MMDALRKLDPRVQWRNPVMFVVYIGSILTTALWAQALGGQGEAPGWFIFDITLWLWFTVLFANFAEASAEGRSKAQAASLRGLKQTVLAKKLAMPTDRVAITRKCARISCARTMSCWSKPDDYMPGDGEVIEGAASVDESAITGESAPVIRESGGDFSSVTGGTRVLSDWIVVRITVNPGEIFHRSHDLDGGERQAAKDAERNRADHSAGRADAGVPVRHRHAVAVLAVQRRGQPSLARR